MAITAHNSLPLHGTVRIEFYNHYILILISVSAKSDISAINCLSNALTPILIFCCT